MNSDFSTYGLILLAYAEVAATLTGFIGVVFVLGERSRGQVTQHEASAIFHFLLSAVSALFVSLSAAILLVVLAANEHLAWRIANTVSGLIHLIGAGRLAVETFKEKSAMRLGLTTSAMGMVIAAVSFGITAGYLRSAESAVFMLATLWMLGVTVIAFVSLLVSVAPNQP